MSILFKEMDMKRSYLKRSTKPLKRTKLRKKRRKSSKSPLELAKDNLEAIQRFAIIRRDKKCVLKGIIKHNCNKVLQADHLITRGAKSIFFDLENLNLICSNMNRQKGRHWYGWESIQRALERITEERYGAGTVEMLEFKKKALKTWTFDEIESLTAQYENIYRWKEN